MSVRTIYVRMSECHDDNMSECQYVMTIDNMSGCPYVRMSGDHNINEYQDNNTSG